MVRSLEPGDTLAGYRIESLLGRGGMATVYLAEHDRLKRKVALKVLSPDLAADETFRQRFVSESERLASVDHPNIIPVYEAGEVDSLLFIAMRYVDTTDLKRLIAEEGGLDPERALSIVSQVAGALDAAHARGLVHRDVKPANVLVAIGAGHDATDHAYLSDFGLTKRTEETSGLTRTGYFMGTIDYVAPEQISGKGIDGRTDQYALGCVLFESLSGQAPYKRDEDGAVLFAHLSEPPPSLTALRPDLPAGIDLIIATAMAKNKEDRYPYCVAFARAARAAIFGPRAITPPTGIESGEAKMASAIAVTNQAPPTPPATPVPATMPAPPPAPEPSAPEPVIDTAPTPVPVMEATRAAEPPGSDRGKRGLQIVIGVVLAALLGVGAFVLFSGDDETLSDPTGTTGATTGTTGTTGATGATTGTTGTTGATGATGFEQLSEAEVFGTWDMTFSPEGDTSAGSATNTTWVLEENCDARSGPHPCDVDAVSPVSGFIQRVGKDYAGTVTGELPCGQADMQVSFTIVRAVEVTTDEGRATEIVGEGTLLSGTCAGSVFTLVGRLS